MGLAVKREAFEMVMTPDEHDPGRLGVQARVYLYLPLGDGSLALHEVISPGLWDIERDTGEIYLASVYEEECKDLEAMLEALGVTVFDDPS